MTAYLITLSLLIAVVLLIRAVFRKSISPRVMYALWLVVVVRLCLPVSLFAIPVDIPSLFQQTSVQNALPADTNSQPAQPSVGDTVSPPAADYEIPTTALPTVPVPSVPSAPETDVPALHAPDAPHIQASVPEPDGVSPWMMVVGIVWLIGSVGLAVWFTVTTALFRLRLRRDRELYQTVGHTKVYISESAGVPCLSGFIPSIYITPDAANSEARTLILLHERVHMHHGDHIWAYVRAIALVVHWWNPLIWTAAFLSKRDAELACDDAIASKLHEENRLKYARVLLDTIPQKHRYAVGLGSAPMKERILMLTTKQKNRWVCLVLALVLTLSAASCSFVTLHPETKNEVVSVLISQEDALPDKEPYVASIGKGGTQNYFTFEKGLTYYRLDTASRRVYRHELQLPAEYTEGNICFAYAGEVTKAGEGNGEIHFLLEAVRKDETVYLACYFTPDFETEPAGNLVLISMEEISREQADLLRGIQTSLAVGDILKETVPCLPHGVEMALWMAGFEGFKGGYYLFASGIDSLEYYRWGLFPESFQKNTLTLPEGYTNGKIVHAVTESGEVESKACHFYVSADHVGERVCLDYYLTADIDACEYKLQSVTRLNTVQMRELQTIQQSIYLCDDVYIGEDTPTHGAAQLYIPTALTDYQAECKVLLCEDGCDPAAVLSRAFWGYAPAWTIDRYEEFSPDDGWNYPTRRYINEVPEEIREQMKAQGAPDWVMFPRRYLYLVTLDDTHYAYILIYPRYDEAEKPADEESVANEIIKHAEIVLSPDVPAGMKVNPELFAWETIRFSYQKENASLSAVQLQISLPKEWRVSYGYSTYEVPPFAEYADLYAGDDCVGGIGFLPYTLPDIPADQEIPREAIFHQLTMGSMSVWNIHQHFDVVSDPAAPYCTARTSVLYSSKAFSDGKERTDNAIVTYHPEYKMYFALKLNDGIKDRTLLSEEEIQYMAQSIRWVTEDTSALYKQTEAYLAQEFHRVFDPYYDIQDLIISGWNESGNEATFYYKMTHYYVNKDPDLVEYIRKHKETDPETYEMLYKDYLALKEGNIYFKVILVDGEIELYANTAPPIGEPEWERVQVDDYIQ